MSGLNYIDGAWSAAASGETDAKVNPIRSYEVVGTFASSDEQDADTAIGAAERAFESCAVERAVEAAFAGAFWSAGQKCTATRRVYVQAEIYERFRDLFLARTARAEVGDPLDDSLGRGRRRYVRTEDL